MPLYEYKCQKCDAVFEVLQKFSDAPLTVHAGCGGRVHRLLTAPAFQFKGSGWYVTDYAKKHSSSPSHDAGNNGSDGASAKASEPAKESAAKDSAGTTASKPAESAPSASKS